ncbi:MULTISPECIES: hypothetical protein [Aerosakkonema]|uniref:hypothetical protein n=1 Tax=Aerosakkonema TaxID=1246629 RepID=UPI0035B9C63D
MTIVAPNKVLDIEAEFMLKERMQEIKQKNKQAFIFYFSLITFFFLLAQKTLAQPAPAMPMFENVSIGPGFKPDPTIIRGISGGSQRAADIAGVQETTNGPCVGFVGSNPSHTLVLASGFNYLRLQVDSPEDTTLIIKGPGGTWCNDDNDKKNAGIAGQWLAGTYSIWIGSYQKDKFTPYLIRITQIQ